MKNLNIIERRNGKVVILDLEGNIRLGEDSTQFRQFIRQLVQNGEKSVLLNLENITYVDSSGLGEIVAGFTSLEKVGGTMKLINLNSRISELMMITKLLTVFEVFDSEKAAVESFMNEPENTETKQSSLETAELNPALVNL